MIQKYNLNIIPSGVMPVVYCSQYDTFRTIVFTIYENDEVLDITGLNATLQPFNKACTVSDVVSFDIDESMTQEAKDIMCEIVLDTVGSLNFILRVDKTV